MLIDGHLDLAMNAVDGRDLTLPLDTLRAHDPVPGQTATVSFPELRAAGVRVCFGTLFALPHSAASPAGYTGPQGARAQALAQLDVYHRWQDQGHVHLLPDAAAVAAHLGDPDAPLGVVLLMEGADPIRDASDLPFWVQRGVRVIGPAWGRTRYAGGTAAPGPLTPAGHDLVTAMRDLGVTLDASHLDDAAFWDAAQIGPKLIATHANSRAFVPGNRHLTDDMVRTIAQADGVIGLVLLNRFLHPLPEGSLERVPLATLAAHAAHYASLVGWNRVALGTDLDGGFGAEKTPAGINRYRDVPQVLGALPEAARPGIAAGNWARWLTTHL
ncbi:membrane dipeptidase [Deinococcus taeanensis]|uniref:dipeptidase n=1 Tax=Deinococcus taeanensis TaxID=2737050 RepID=UPI001CDC78FF|nr:membrane dipeptidase [Deinococcus taeanensis]UBV44003.1 membrane dipeptidase [Deinococcus taeanensis]